MDFIEYKLSVVYAMETYARRDIAFVMSKINEIKSSGSGNKPKGKTLFKMVHPAIDKYIKDSYKIAEEGTVLNV